MRGNLSPVRASRKPAGSIPAYAGEPETHGHPLKTVRVYPRVCGGTILTACSPPSVPGLSPHMRGNHAGPPTSGPVPGSIPAYAGEPRPCAGPPTSGPVYPRVCGGTMQGRQHPALCQGLSPRMRGNRLHRTERTHRGRSIPAYAGEPGEDAGDRVARAVYPRVCGGTNNAQTASAENAGLSPRMRGNPNGAGDYYPATRSIPAYAGEPTLLFRQPDIGGVYPRVCGGTAYSRPPTTLTPGLSPRMRGNLQLYPPQSDTARSIPAYAGEPSFPPCTALGQPVYPRVCGGTNRPLHRLGKTGGLSPRMRGNPHAGSAAAIRNRSIPAYAGEPDRSCVRRCRYAVYPRVCGGTKRRRSSACHSRGLSPRMRGNPYRQHDGNYHAGSIPAYAGEPPLKKGSCAVCPVYPRVCGGTLFDGEPADLTNGLSPRMRGNLRQLPVQRCQRRSIPAYAGEPVQPPPAPTPAVVYPRVCGGTVAIIICPPGLGGLSPRMRGNRGVGTRRVFAARSIPAYAGEPSVNPKSWNANWVYPRVCGGTGYRFSPVAQRQGLSPRMRGNPSSRLGPDCGGRSIPAYAGEPDPSAVSVDMHRVYPRVCGGTHGGVLSSFAKDGLSPRMRGNRAKGWQSPSG